VVASLVGGFELGLPGMSPGVPGPFGDTNFTGE
jgi:hypothetical protein